MEEHARGLKPPHLRAMNEQVGHSGRLGVYTVPV